MGQSLSTYEATILASKKENKEIIEEQLKFLMNAANSHLDTYESELRQQHTSKAYDPFYRVPGSKDMDLGYGFKVNASESARGISNEVDYILKINQNPNESDDTKALDCLKNIVAKSLRMFLRRDYQGQHEEQQAFFFVHRNDVVRIDVRLWRYNFSNKSIIAELDNALCYILCISPVDTGSLSLEDFFYHTELDTEDSDLEPYKKKISDAWQMMTQKTRTRP